MDFELPWLLWALPLAFAFGWIGSRFDVRQWKRDHKASPKVLYNGLNFLLNEQHDKAIDSFIEALRQDPDTAELHFALGNLFRRRGEYERAVRVHQHLLHRADLPKAERERAQHELAQDFMKAGIFDRAEASYQTLSGTAFDTESRLALLVLHERSRDWRAAVDIARQLEASASGSFSSRIAHYACELALEADAAGKPDDAESFLREAREAAPQAARPSVLAGQRAAGQGRHDEAIRQWNTLMTTQPGAFNLVARDYAASALALGTAPAALARLAPLYRQTPTIDLLEAMAALDAAPVARHARLLTHLREHPTLAAARAVLDEDQTSSCDAVPGAIRDAVRRAARPLHRYRCAACGFEAEHYFWQCPGCLGWDTYPPQRLEDL